MSDKQSCAGRFVWYDLMTTDKEKSIDFYTKLLGWKVKDVEMGPGAKYTMINTGSRDIGGMDALDPSRGIPSHWIAYVTVDDVDAAVAKTKELGGDVKVPPTPIPNVGRFAVIADPTGAHICPFKGESGGEMPAEAWPPPIGTVCWNELLTTSVPAAASFYETVFGWTATESEMGSGDHKYWLFKAGQEQRAGLMKMPKDAQAPSHWLPYVAVADVDACMRKVADLGGRVCVPPTDIPKVGRFAVAFDPNGAVIAFLQAAV